MEREIQATGLEAWTDDERAIINAQLTGPLTGGRTGFMTSRGAVETYRAMKQVLADAGWMVVRDQCPECDRYLDLRCAVCGSQPW